MQRIFYFFFLLFFTHQLVAQQYPLFTNYPINSYGFNPAVAGSNPYWDARATYRTQWVGIDGAPTTQILSVHGPLNALGVGGYFFNDTAGKLKRTGGTATVSYGLRFSNTGEIRAGIGLNTFRFGPTSDAGTSGTPDPLLMEGTASTLTDLSAGVFLHLKNGFYLGVSNPQMLKRTIDLTDTEGMDRELIPHFYLMTGYRMQLADKLALEPSVLIKQTEGAPIQYDLSLRAFLGQKLWLGGTYRQGAAAAGMVGYDINSAINLAYAYDMTFNDLKESSSGSHEITIGFKFGYPKDRDQDGIPDKKDKCPDEPGIKKFDGCPPETLADKKDDQDGDGVLDPFDECPYRPGPAENDGCPLDSDRDQDGLADINDRCPDEYGLAIHEGCPFEDADGDLVEDELDRCPLTPGPKENEGCPVATPAEESVLDLAARNLYFDTNKASIKSESLGFLDKLADLMLERPSYRVKIEGHTDSTGDVILNYELSKDRANAVRDYLVSQGVRMEQLQVEYYGETKPIASNMTEKTRRLNRRVEMSFVWD